VAIVLKQMIFIWPQRLKEHNGKNVFFYLSDLSVFVVKLNAYRVLLLKYFLRGNIYLGNS